MSRDTAHGVLIFHNDIVPESLVDMPGDRKVEPEPLSNNPNASLYRIAKEDHTLGYLLQKKLHEDTLVKVAGYRVPHPTKHTIELRVQTGRDGSGREIPTPSAAVDKALTAIIGDLKDFRAQLVADAQQKGFIVDPALEHPPAGL